MPSAYFFLIVYLIAARYSSIPTTRTILPPATMKGVCVSGMSTRGLRWSTTRSTARGSGVSSTTQRSRPCTPQAPMTAQVTLNLLTLSHISFFSSSPLVVKLWCTSRPHSIFKIDAKANVCSVRFHPVERHYLAYGSAGHYTTALYQLPSILILAFSL